MMPMIIQDIKIKGLLREYQNNDAIDDNESCYQELVEMVSNFIYNFPRIKYYKNMDICSEFYIYVSNYLSHIFYKFNINGKATFQTWFTIVLVNLWRNFSKTLKKRDENYIEYITKKEGDLSDLDRYNYLRYSIIYNSIEDTKEDSDSIYIDNVKIDSLDTIFKKMPQKVRVVIKAHFFELFNDKDINDAVESFQLDFMVTLRKYELLVANTRDQYVVISNIIDKLNNIEYEINKLKEEFNSANDRITYQEYSNKLHRLEKIKYKKIDEIKSKYIKISHKDIAGLFNTNTNNVSNLLHRGKNYIKEFYAKKMKTNKTK